MELDVAHTKMVEAGLLVSGLSHTRRALPGFGCCVTRSRLPRLCNGA